MGHAELGAEDYGSELEFDGREAVGIGLTQLSNANAIEVDRLAIQELDRLSKRFPPGMKYHLAFDTTDAVSESINDVLSTLIEAIVLVILVIFIFLEDWRSTIIPVGHNSRFSDRNICLYQAAGVLYQYAHAVRDHAGHRVGGG